jgi:hypothetical protein
MSDRERQEGRCLEVGETCSLSTQRAGVTLRARGCLGDIGRKAGWIEQGFDLTGFDLTGFDLTGFDLNWGLELNGWVRKLIIIHDIGNRE